MVALFFMLGWDRYGFDKNGSRTRCAELVFFHQVGCAGHVEYSGASGVRNVDDYFSYSGGPRAVSIKSAPGHATLNLCFCILWDLRAP
jgi:hypothetical protein